MLIRKANFDDLLQVLEIYESARRFMRESGNPNQWGKTNPSRDCTENDIYENKLYVVEDKGDILAVFFYNFADDPTYKVIYG